MKRIIVVAMCLIFLAGTVWAATEYKSNAYQKVFGLQSSQTATMTFPYNSRDITVINGDANNAVGVDFTSTQATAVTTITNSGSTYFMVPKLSSVTFQNYVTGGLTLFTYTGTASPVSVIVTY